MVQQIKQPDSSTYWKFCPLVILLTAISFLLGGFLSTQILAWLWPALPNTDQFSTASVRDLLDLGLILLCASIVSGVANYALLRRIYTHLPLRHWLLITTLAALSIVLVISIMPMQLFSYLPRSVSALMIGASIGGIIGLAQWGILRKYGTNPQWWIIASILTWMATMGLLMLMTTTSTPVPDM